MPAVQPLAVSIILEIFRVHTRTVKVKIVPTRVVLMPERENRIIVILVDAVTGKFPDDFAVLSPRSESNTALRAVDIALKRRFPVSAWSF